MEPYYFDKKKGMLRQNCYSYAFSMRGGRLMTKPQPGENSALGAYRGRKPIDCAQLVKRALSDFRGVARLKPATGKCRRDEDEIASFVDTVVDPETDYHFYRRLSGERLWSHKRGLSQPTKVDAKGKLIVNPTKASRKYTDSLDYSTPCPRICLQRNKGNNRAKKNIAQKKKVAKKTLW
jgi:hypothetical protein